MISSSFINAIIWHFECMDLARKAIDNFRPPADSFQMRMNYSLYLINLMSAVDMLGEECGEPFNTELKESLKTSAYSGQHILCYMRDLRNSIVHRGFDPTTEGVELEGLVLALAPTAVQNRNGSRSYTAPAQLLREIFIHCEICAKPIFERFLEPSLKAINATTSEGMMEAYHEALDGVQHMPDWAKEMARNNVTPEILAMAQSNQVEKLRTILKPPIGRRIA